MKQFKIHLALAGIPTIGQAIDNHINRHSEEYVYAGALTFKLIILGIFIYLIR